MTIGLLTTPYKASGKKGDPFWDTPAGTTFAANNFGFSSLTRGFTSHSYIYKSPSIKNIRFTLGYSGTNSNGDSQIGFEHSLEKLTWGIQHIDFGEDYTIANGQDKALASRVFSRYQNGDWNLSASYENIENTNASTSEFFNFSLEKALPFGRFAASYGLTFNTETKLFNGRKTFGDGIGLSTGIFYEWVKESELYLIATHIDLDNGEKQNTLALGFNYHYNI